MRAFGDIGASLIVTTKEQTFVDKAKVLPGRKFVVGYDTAVRIVDPRYYGDGKHEEMVAALADVYRNGGRFLVGGRLVGSSFHTLHDGSFPFPEGLPRDLFQEIPDFRIDLSSTELR